MAWVKRLRKGLDLVGCQNGSKTVKYESDLYLISLNEHVCLVSRLNNQFRANEHQTAYNFCLGFCTKSKNPLKPVNNNPLWIRAGAGTPTVNLNHMCTTAGWFISKFQKGTTQTLIKSRLINTSINKRWLVIILWYELNKGKVRFRFTVLKHKKDNTAKCSPSEQVFRFRVLLSAFPGQISQGL